jgi:ketosteroid isomerase-like protein
MCFFSRSVFIRSYLETFQIGNYFRNQTHFWNRGLQYPKIVEIHGVDFGGFRVDHTYRPVYLRCDAENEKGGGTMKRFNLVNCGVVIVALALVMGCQSAPKGPSDEELIGTVISSWKDALLAKDFDALAALYSENFVGAQGEDKAGMRQFLEQAGSMGYLDGMTIDTETAETVIEEDKATVGPITISGAMGSMGMTHKLAKEEDGWLIVGGEQG